MADPQPDNIMLVYLRRIDEKLDRVVADVGDLKLRVTALESDVARIATQTALVNARIDRVESRLERIERRLDLVGSEPT